MEEKMTPKQFLEIALNILREPEENGLDIYSSGLIGAMNRYFQRGFDPLDFICTEMKKGSLLVKVVGDTKIIFNPKEVTDEIRRECLSGDLTVTLSQLGKANQKILKGETRLLKKTFIWTEISRLCGGKMDFRQGQFTKSRSKGTVELFRVDPSGSVTFYVQSNKGNRRICHFRIPRDVDFNEAKKAIRAVFRKEPYFNADIGKGKIALEKIQAFQNESCAKGQVPVLSEYQQQLIIMSLHESRFPITKSRIIETAFDLCSNTLGDLREEFFGELVQQFVDSGLLTSKDEGLYELTPKALKLIDEDADGSGDDFGKNPVKEIVVRSSKLVKAYNVLKEAAELGEDGKYHGWGMNSILTKNDLFGQSTNLTRKGLVALGLEEKEGTAASGRKVVVRKYVIDPDVYPVLEGFDDGKGNEGVKEVVVRSQAIIDAYDVAKRAAKLQNDGTYRGHGLNAILNEEGFSSQSSTLTQRGFVTLDKSDKKRGGACAYVVSASVKPVLKEEIRKRLPEVVSGKAGSGKEAVQLDISDFSLEDFREIETQIAFEKMNSQLRAVLDYLDGIWSTERLDKKSETLWINEEGRRYVPVASICLDGESSQTALRRDLDGLIWHQVLEEGSVMGEQVLFLLGPGKKSATSCCVVELLSIVRRTEELGDNIKNLKLAIPSMAARCSIAEIVKDKNGSYRQKGEIKNIFRAIGGFLTKKVYNEAEKVIENYDLFVGLQ